MGRLQRYDVKPYGGKVFSNLEDLFTRISSLSVNNQGPLGVEIVITGTNEVVNVKVDPENFAEFLEILRLTVGPSEEGKDVL